MDDRRSRPTSPPTCPSEEMGSGPGWSSKVAGFGYLLAISRPEQFAGPWCDGRSFRPVLRESSDGNAMTSRKAGGSNPVPTLIARGRSFSLFLQARFEPPFWRPSISRPMDGPVVESVGFAATARKIP